MRSREEINTQFKQDLHETYSKEVVTHLLLGNVVELLLDIRDLLQAKEESK